MPAFQADRLGCSIQEVYLAIKTKNLYKRKKDDFVTSQRDDKKIMRSSKSTASIMQHQNFSNNKLKNMVKDTILK